MINFIKGQKVVCIDDIYKIDKTHPQDYKRIVYPVKNSIYTIRDIVKGGLKFEEIKNKDIHHDVGGYKEPVFSTSRFEPLRDYNLEILLK
jgi:hypothetical protein